jgi:tyrosinase
VFPDSVGSPWVDADGPAGVQRIANPLFSYQFQPLNTTELPNPPVSKSGFELDSFTNSVQFTIYQQTMRYPNTTAPNAVSQNHRATTNMDKNSGIFRSRLYNLFTNYHDYSTFSNEAWIPEGSTGDFDSLESIHDQVHGFSGGGGHMSYIDYSAFDPLFMLHHVMVDRCFALWQILNPDSYVEPAQVKSATYSIPAGSTVDMYTPLQPFYNASGDFWDSATVRATETFGYVYPETANNGTSADRANAVMAINRLYGPATTSFTGQLSRKRDHGVRGRVSGTQEYREWIANILVRKHALSGPFFIHIFLGAIDADSQTWATQSALVGTHCIFDKMDSAASSTADFVTGTIPLTAALRTAMDNEDLLNLDPEVVEQFLETRLRFKVSSLNYTAVDASRIPSLRVQVVTANVQKEAGEGVLPVWGAIAESVEVREG